MRLVFIGSYRAVIGLIRRSVNGYGEVGGIGIIIVVDDAIAKDIIGRFVCR